MISGKKDCSDYLDELRLFSKNYRISEKGEIVDKEGNVVTDQHIIRKTKFYILYCLAYKALDEATKMEEVEMNQNLIDRALGNYSLFNYLINVAIAEYQIYDEIGTGILTYLPYEQAAAFFFEDEGRRKVFSDYVIFEIMELENTKRDGRVK